MNTFFRKDECWYPAHVLKVHPPPKESHPDYNEDQEPWHRYDIRYEDFDGDPHEYEERKPSHEVQLHEDGEALVEEDELEEEQQAEGDQEYEKGVDNADLSKEDNDLEERVDLESLEFREQPQKADAKAIDTLRESREIRNDGGDEDEGVNLRSGPVLVESIIGQPEDAESALQPFLQN